MKSKILCDLSPFKNSRVESHTWLNVKNINNLFWLFQTYDIGQYVVEVQEQFEDAPTEFGMMIHREKGLKAADATR